MSKPRLQMILSPAKTMNFASCDVADAAGASEAVGLSRVNELAALLKTKSKAELTKILNVNDKIATENYERFADWDAAEPRQAVVAYAGFAYDKLQARTLSADQLQVGQRRLLILSGMWGPVRPLDRIKPYRLEMACKALPEPYKKLAAYWQDTSTETLLAGFADGGDRALVNIASDEYAAAIDFDAVKAAGVQVVKIEFHQGGKKAPTVHLKHGRGLVARYIMLHDVDSVDALKGFDLEDYSFSASASKDDVLVFSRDAAPAKKPAAKKARKA
mmetsp:Transcript_28828/g.89084  ORF Transcript_28828/g.89084 Transcript_28828/m.89084 type:complete len:274 (+) Transcript_28828:558-1379(+)